MSSSLLTGLHVTKLEGRLTQVSAIQIITDIAQLTSEWSQNKNDLLEAVF